jgi:hypothetical protein
MDNSNSTTRTRTHSALKWMANERAAVLGELTLVCTAVDALQERKSRLQAQLDALDTSMRRFDPELDPSTIRAVAAWKERNGGRGTMQGYFLAALEQAGELGLTAPMLLDMWAAELGDATLTVQPVRERFRMNRITPCLKRLKAKGQVTCEPIPGGGHNDYLWKVVKQPRRR